MKYFYLLLLIPLTGFAQQKKPLTVDDFTHWKSNTNVSISPNGKFICYEQNPQKGDGKLILYDVEKNTSDTLVRGKKAAFTFNSHFLIWHRQPTERSIHDLKLKKEKKEKFPKDSVFVLNLKTNQTTIFENVRSYQIPKTQGEWIAILTDSKKPEVVESDSTKKEEKKAPKPEKRFEDAGDLLVVNLETKQQFSFAKVEDIGFSTNGATLFFTRFGTAPEEKGIYFFDTETSSVKTIHNGYYDVKQFCLDSTGGQIAFVASLIEPDKKSKEKIQYSIRYTQTSIVNTTLVADSVILNKFIEDEKTLIVNEKQPIYFTKNGSRLYFSTQLKSKLIEPDTTLLDEDKPKLDVWSHHDGRLQPEQVIDLKDDEKKGFAIFWDIKKAKLHFLGTEQYNRIVFAQNGEADFALGFDNTDYRKTYSWQDKGATDVDLIYTTKAEKIPLLTNFIGNASFSPNGNYVYGYNEQDSSWFIYNIKTKKKTNLRKLIPENCFNEEDDHPSFPGSYGHGGWMKNDQLFFVYSRFNIWAIDPTGKRNPRSIIYKTQNDIVYRLDHRNNKNPWHEPNDYLYIEMFHSKTKETSYGKVLLDDKFELLSSDLPKCEPFSIQYYGRSANKSISVYSKGHWSKYPEFCISRDGLARELKPISQTNKQQKLFKWYEVELVNFLSTDGESLQGLLYKPENFDPSKKYPMIVYFYEKSSDGLFNYQTPRPSYSTINKAFYCSNDYFVFVPDIVYEDGFPGPSAFNCIIPGVLKVLGSHPEIDSKRLGLQGQSWGGYQTAYLITQSKLFAAAMAGAPVSNMTSAYGGMRWGSGLSRAFQYEGGQSRIGGSLWEKPMQYYLNSPVFFADKVQTPLLIMHNDNDGAVPWYQGIEYFNALRRLDKPVWMLVYNGEEHNLTKWPNRVDLSNRMFGFFNHYLKDAPMPAWMKEGVSAIEKGNVLKY